MLSMILCVLKLFLLIVVCYVIVWRLRLFRLLRLSFSPIISYGSHRITYCY
jgi:hypothetical protein